MKKRILSLLLLVATIVTALPLVTFSVTAADGEEPAGILYGEEDYNAFYVKGGALMLSDFFTLGEAWGKKLELPTAPGTKPEFDTVEERLADGDRYIVVRQEGTDADTWQYMNNAATPSFAYYGTPTAYEKWEDALLVAYQKAGHADATALPEGAAEGDKYPNTADGYTYYVVKKWHSAGKFVEAEAWKNAKTNYGAELDKVLASFTYGSGTVTYNHFITGFGLQSYQDVSGRKIITHLSQGDGYLVMNPWHGNQYVSLGKIPTSGVVYVEDIIGFDDPKGTASVNLLCLREVDLRGSLNAAKDTLYINTTSTYQGTVAVPMTKPGVVSSLKTPVTLQMMTDTAVPELAYVAIRTNSERTQYWRKDGAFGSATTALKNHVLVYDTKEEAMLAAYTAGSIASITDADGNSYKISATDDGFTVARTKDEVTDYLTAGAAFGAEATGYADKGEAFLALYAAVPSLVVTDANGYVRGVLAANKREHTLSAWLDGEAMIEDFVVLDAPQKEGDNKADATLNTLITYSSENNFALLKYALRLYDRELTEAEQAQNHLADLLKFYRLDLGYIKMLDEEGLAAVALAVCDVPIGAGKTVVENAVQTAARREAEARYAGIQSSVFRTLALYQLGTDIVEAFPMYRLPRTYAYLTEGYRAAADATEVKEGYEAAVLADVEAIWASNASGDIAADAAKYNALYVTDGMTVGLDWYLNNEYWGATETAPDATIYKWKWEHTHSMIQSPFNATVKNGALVMTGNTYIGNTSAAVNYGFDGMTGEFVFVDATAPGTSSSGANFLNYNDMRFQAFGGPNYEKSIVRLGAIGQRDYGDSGILRTESADGGLMGRLNQVYAQYTLDGKATTFSLLVDRSPLSVYNGKDASWYGYNLDGVNANVQKPSTYQLAVGLILSYEKSTNTTNKGYYTTYTTNLEKLSAEHQKALIDVLKTTYVSKTFTVDTTGWTDDEKAALAAITEVIGKVYSYSTTYFYVTHRLVEKEVDGVTVQVLEPVENSVNTSNGISNYTKNTRFQYAYYRPVYHEEDGKRYIVSAQFRTENNGIGMGQDEVEGANFYTDDPSCLSVRMNGDVLLERKDLYFPNNKNLTGGTYLLFSYSTTRTLYAHRDYMRVLSAEELTRNHFADIAKCFRLDLFGIELLDERGLAEVYASVADLDVATADRFEAQLIVSRVLTKAYNAAFDAYLEAGIDAIAVEGARVVGADISLLLTLPRAALPTTYQTLAAILHEYESGTLDVSGGASRVALAILFDLDSDLEKNDKAAYDALYVRDGSLMMYDYFALNEYWGESIDVPDFPTTFTAYKNVDGELYDFTRVENRMLDSYYGQISRYNAATKKTEYLQYNSWTYTTSTSTSIRAKVPVEQALDYLYKMAGTKRPESITLDANHKTHTVKGTDGNTYTFTLTTTAPTWILMRQKGEDTSTWAFYDVGDSSKNKAPDFTAEAATNKGAAGRGYAAMTFATLEEALALAKETAGGDKATLLDKEATGLDGYLGDDGYTYYVAAKSIAEGDAWMRARTAYTNACNDAINSFANAVDVPTSMKMSQYYPTHGIQSYHTVSGDVAGMPIYTQANGALTISQPHSNVYLSLNSNNVFPQTGTLYMERVASAGAPREGTGKSYTSGNFFTMRDLPLSGKQSAIGLEITGFGTYNGATGFVLEEAIVIEGADTVFTLTYVDGRTDPRTDTYSVFRYKVDEKGNATSVGRLSKKGTWSFSATDHFPVKYTDYAEAVKVAYNKAGVAMPEDGTATVPVLSADGYYYTVQSSYIADRDMKISINGEVVIEAETDEYPYAAGTSVDALTEQNTAASNIFVSFGTNDVSYDLYALRYYNRELSTAEQAQNHFADLAKFYRLDVEYLTLLDADGILSLYAALAPYQIGDLSRYEMQIAYFAAIKAIAGERADAAKAENPEIAKAYPKMFTAAVEYGVLLTPFFTSGRDLSDAFDEITVAALDGLTPTETVAYLAELYHDAYYYLAYKQGGSSAWCEWLDAVAALDTHLVLEPLMALPRTMREGIAEAGVALTQTAVDAYVAEKRAALGVGEAMSPEAYNEFYVDRGLVLAFDIMKSNAYWGMDVGSLPVEPATLTSYMYEGKSYNFTSEDARKGGYTFSRSVKGAAPDHPWASIYSYDTIEELEAGITAYISGQNAYKDGVIVKQDDGTYRLMKKADPTVPHEADVVFAAVADINEAWRAANNEYFKAESAWLAANTWYAKTPSGATDATHLYSYPTFSGGNPTTHLNNLHKGYAAYYVKDGYIQMRDDHISDGGLQLSGLHFYMSGEGSTLQMVASAGNPKTHPLLFHNIRAEVLSEDGEYYYTGKVGSAISAETTPTADRSATAVESISYNLIGLPAYASVTANAKYAATYSVTTHTGEEIFTVSSDYTYTTNNYDTNYISYQCYAKGAKIYAIRYYNTTLTAEEKLQNHFVDLAKYYRLDLADYRNMGTAERAAIHEAMKGFAVADADRVDVLEAYVAACYKVDYDDYRDALSAEFLAIAEYLCLDLSEILAIKNEELWAALTTTVTENYAMGYAMEREVVQAVLDDATFFLKSIDFAGMSVRVSDGWSVDTPGVRGCFTVSEEALRRLAGKSVSFGVEILNKDGVVKATLTFTPTFCEDGSITYKGTSVSASTQNGKDAYLQDSGEADVKTFAYSVIYNGAQYQTAAYYNAEYAYRSFLVIDGVRYERDLAHKEFGETITAAEVYEHFYKNTSLKDKTGKPFAENALVKAVVAELAKAAE